MTYVWGGNQDIDIERKISIILEKYMTYVRDSEKRIVYCAINMMDINKMKEEIILALDIPVIKDD